LVVHRVWLSIHLSASHRKVPCALVSCIPCRCLRPAVKVSGRSRLVCLFGPLTLGAWCGVRSCIRCLWNAVELGSGCYSVPYLLLCQWHALGACIHAFGVCGLPLRWAPAAILYVPYLLPCHWHALCACIHAFGVCRVPLSWAPAAILYVPYLLPCHWHALGACIHALG